MIADWKSRKNKDTADKPIEKLEKENELLRQLNKATRRP